METIKNIFDEISSEPGTNKKMEILSKYKDNELLKRVLYMANSNRVKFYIKQIPEYINPMKPFNTLDDAIRQISVLSERKVTGHDAINHLKSTLESLSSDDAYILERIIEKDCKIGMGRTNINKIFLDLIEKTPYMGAKAFDEKLARDILKEGYAFSQVKMDGRYCNAIIENGDVYLESRSGEPTIIIGATILDELSKFDDGVLNGELTIDGVDRNTSNGIINSIISISGKIKNGEDHADDISHLETRHNMTYHEALNRIRYTVWDSISIEEYHNRKSDVSYGQRLFHLTTGIHARECKQVSLIENETIGTYKEAIAHFINSLKLGLEGTILKSSQGTWKDGKPKWQIKMKLEIDIDMKIVDFNYGTKGTKNEHVIASLTVESACGKVVTRPTGISESDMKYITENQNSLLGSIVEMKCCGLSHDNEGKYSTLHPVFKSIRHDKDTCDSLDSIIAIENMAKSLSDPKLST